MNHDQKMAFLQNMTHMALSHAASTPNVPTPKGGMSHDKMMSFVSGIATKGLQHLADGGTLLGGPTTQSTNANTTSGGIGGGLANIVGSSNQFQAAAAPIQAGTNTGQLNNAYTGAQQALSNQNNIASTLTPGVSQGADQQANLSNLYMNQINGGGPNPALAQLNQTTGQNISQQAALAAGQRGAGANAGLLARESAQQGAATQQQAVGQAATLQAQQQLAAEQNLQNLSSSQIGQGTAAVQGQNNAQQNEQNVLQGANTAFNNAQVGQQSNINNVNAAVATQNSNNSGGLFGDLAGGISSALGSIFAHGGEVKKDKQQVEMKPMVRAPMKMAEGGLAVAPTSGPQSYVGQWLNSTSNTQGPQIAAPLNVDTSFHDPFAKVKSPIGAPPESLLKGFNPADAGTIGEAGAADLPGIIEGGAEIAALAYKGGKLMKQGGDVPGKAKVNHDSIKNDTVPAVLSPGEVVIDKDTLNDKGTVGQMARAVAAHIAKRNKKK